MKRRRSEGNVTYYDYTKPERFKSVDRFTLAEAFIYAPGDQHHLGIVVSATSPELNGDPKLSDAEAITKGEALRASLVERHREEARTLTANRTYVFGLDGLRIE